MPPLSVSQKNAKSRSTSPTLVPTPTPPLSSSSSSPSSFSSPSPLSTSLQLPTVQQFRQSHNVTAPDQLIASRLTSLAHSYLFLPSTNTTSSSASAIDPLSWQNDLCSATFYATYALCVDPTSIRARQILARCARLGGFNLVLPFSPSASSASSKVSPTRLSSVDPHDKAGAQAAIHILRLGSSETFADPGCAQEYKHACFTLGLDYQAHQVSELLISTATTAKRKHFPDSETLGDSTSTTTHSSLLPPQLVSAEHRYQSQLFTDFAFEAARRHRIQEATHNFKQALAKDPWNWRAWTGLCDLPHDTLAAQVFSTETLFAAYNQLTNDLDMATIQTQHPTSTVSASSTAPVGRVINDDASNKKPKINPGPATSTTVNHDKKQLPPNRKPTLQSNSMSSAPTTKTSRALSNAQTNTNNTESKQPPRDDKRVIRTVSKSRATRSTAASAVPVSAARANGMQLRSSTTRNGSVSRMTRSTAPSQTSSLGPCKNPVSVSRPTASTRRAQTPSTTSEASSTNGSRASSTLTVRSAASTAASSKRPATAIARPTNATFPSTKPPSATNLSTAAATNQRLQAATRKPMSATTAAAPVTFAPTQDTVKQETARLRAQDLANQRAAAMETIKQLAQYQAADLFILSLLRQFGEAYRFLRQYQGSKAIVVLSSPTIRNDPVSDGSNSDAAAGQSSKSNKNQPNHGGDRIVGGVDLETRLKNTIPYQWLLARAYNESSQYLKAEVHFAHARRLNPFALAHTDIYSLVLFHLNREVTLSALAQELSLIDGKSATTQIVIGNAFALQKEHQTAYVCFQRAAAMAPNYAYAYTLAGHEAHDLGHHDQAIAYFRNAIRCDKRHWNAWAGLARVLLGIGDHEHAACKSLQQAIEINPNNHVLWDLVGYIYSQMGKYQEALSAYDRAISLSPTSSVITYIRRAELYQQHGQPSKAHNDLLSAYALAPEEPTIHLFLAQSYMQLADGSFCQFTSTLNSSHQATTASETTASLKSSGTVVMPTRFHAEISHHLAVAIDLDPGYLKLVKALCQQSKSSSSSSTVAATFSPSALLSFDPDHYHQESVIDDDEVERDHHPLPSSLPHVSRYLSPSPSRYDLHPSYYSHHHDQHSLEEEDVTEEI